MFRRKLLKRALPIILSVAMVFETMPATALAAEYEEAEAVVESTVDTQDVEEPQAQSEASKASETEKSEPETAESEKTPETTLEAIETEETADADKTASISEITNATEIDLAEEAGSEEGSQTPTAPDEKDEPTKLVVDYGSIRDAVNDYEAMRYDAETKTIITTYDKEKSNPFGELADDIKNNYISVMVNNEENEIVKTHAQYQWEQKNAEGNYAPMANGGLPVNAGDYRLAVSLGAVEGACEAAETQYVSFRIDQREMEIDYSESIPAVPGTTVGELKADVLENYELEDGFNKNAYVASASVAIKNASDKTELTDDTQKLLKTGDYLLELTITFANEAYANNYKISNSVIKLEVSDAVETIVSVTSKKTDGSDIGKVYDGNAINVETDVTPYFEAVVGELDYNAPNGIKLDEDGNEVILKDAKPTYKWRNANGEEIDAKDVVNAGAYNYVICYEGEEGVYRSAEAEIPVIIRPAEFAIAPVVENKDFYDGIKAEDVLKRVTAELKDAPAALTTAVSEDKYFWGISYNEDGVTQSYEPVFVVQQGITAKTEDDIAKAAATEWSDMKAGDELEKKEGYSYRIIFSGKKAVYDRNGKKLSEDVDINASQENFRVDCSMEKLEAYAFTIDLKASLAEINVDAMLGENKAGNSFDNPITKTFDGVQFFATRDLYKKAVVTAGSDKAEGTDSRITYTWYYLDRYDTKDVLDEKGEPVKDEDGTVKTEKVPHWKPYEYYGYSADVEVTSTPIEAGNYKVTVSYADKKNGVYAQDKDVFYTIQKQNVQILPESTQNAFIGSTVSEFLATIEIYSLYDEVKHSIVKGSVDQETGAFTQDAAVENWTEYDNYRLEWYVERKIKEGSKANTWEELGSGEVFIEGEEYRLAVRFDYLSDFLARNYNNRYWLDKHNEYIEDSEGNNKLAYENGTCAITLTKSEGIKLLFDVDWSKVTKTVKVYDGVPLDNTEIKNALTIRNAKDGSVIDKEALKDKLVYGWRDENGDVYDEDEPIHVGKYYFFAGIAQDDIYATSISSFAYENSDDNDINAPKTFEILPRKLTITPSVKEDVKAGTYIDDGILWIDDVCATDPVVTGYIGRDAWYFEGKTYETHKIARPYAFEALTLSVYEKTSREALSDEYLKGDRSYNVSYDGSLREYIFDITMEQPVAFYAKDYEAVFETVAITPVRGTSKVESIPDDDRYPIKKTRLNDDISGDAATGYTHTITPREGIEYIHDQGYMDCENGKELSGNYFAFRITAPKEYTNNEDFVEKVVYENNIKAKGGYLLRPLAVYDGELAQFTVMFDASAKDKKEFEIIWEDGYSEKFVVDFSKCILKDDLTKAVLPKSLAFNGAVTKMTVGQSQQLDLKITTNQLGDVICIKYESSDPEVLNITESGYVTALSTKGAKSAQVTVSAYASYMADNGEKTVFLDEKKGVPAKVAQAKITVSPVAAVKGVKVEAHDTYAYVDYPNTTLTDGTRREVYVLEGKKTVDEFEAEIAKASNGNYDAFVGKPIFTTSKSKTALIRNGKRTEYFHKITGLTPNTPEYTVYVRNVSLLRTMTDGNKVEDSYAGVVSTFKTTKAQEIGLHAYFDTKEGKDDTRTIHAYTVPIVDENNKPAQLQLNVEAKYLQGYGTEYSDSADFIWRGLPLDKKGAEFNTYADPTLTYYVTDALYKKQEDIANGIHVGDYWFVPSSKIAAIDKKGKLKLTGVGEVFIFVYDEETKEYDLVSLEITSKPDSVTAKPNKVKLSVGNSMYLSDYLIYKQGSTTLNGYCDWVAYKDDWYSGKPDLTISPVSDENFEITPMYSKLYYGKEDENDKDDQLTKVVDYLITAKKPGGTLALTVTDNTVKANGGSDATITIQSAEIAAIKGLKAHDVLDKFGYITFTYSAFNDFKNTVDGNKFAFRIEVKDASGKILSNKLVNPYVYDAEINEDYGRGFVSIVYDAKKNLETYTYFIDGLTRLSNYTVSVTPVYGEYESLKPATAKLKTTNTPASYENVVADYGLKDDGGESIAVKTSDGEVYLEEYPVLKSGNTYTLELPNVNSYARLMKTDSLTWKITSKDKAATVKANAGTYTAALKTTKKGEAVITVTSKITKKIIARWTIYVNAVGEADGYYGDHYEEYDGVDAIENLAADVLTLNNPLTVTLKKGEEKLVAFTAPAYGEYTITSKEEPFFVYELNNDRLERIKNINRTTEYSDTMQKGETYVFLLSGSGKTTITATGTAYASVVTGSNKVKGGSRIHFVAPEDNYYTFTFKKNGEVVLERQLPLYKGEVCTDITAPEENGEYTLEITLRKPDSIDKNADKSVDIEKDGEQWFTFTADETGLYTIYTKDAKESVEAELYWSLIDEIGDGEAIEHYDIVSGDAGTEGTTTVDHNNIKLENYALKKGATIYIRLSSTDTEIENKGIKLRIDQTKAIPGPAVVEKAGDTQWLAYVVENDGDYRFKAEYTKSADESLSVGLTAYVEDFISDKWDYYEFNSDVAEIMELKKGELVIFEINADKGSTSVTINKEGIKATELKADKDEAKEIVIGTSESFTFMAPADGWYNLDFTVDKQQNETDPEVIAEITDTVKKATEFVTVNKSKTHEIYLKAGDVRTITISSSDAQKPAKVTIKVTQQAVSQLTSDTITLKAGEMKRYYWTAEKEGLYDFKATVTPEDGTVTVQQADTLNGVYRTCDLEELSGYKKNGETVYLTLEAGDKDASYKIEIAETTVASMTAGKEESVELEPGAAKWFEFTARKTTLYEYNKADAAGFRIQKSSGLNGALITAFDDRYVWHMAGEKLFFKVTNNNAEKKTIKLTISELTQENIPEVTLEKAGTATVADGTTEQIFRFAAADAARYQFSAKAETKNEAGETVPVSAELSYTEKLQSTVKIGVGSVLFIKQGGAIYLYVTTQSEGAVNVTLTATKITAAQLELNKDTSVAFTADKKTEYLELTVPEDGIYTFTAEKTNVAEGESKTPSGLTAIYYTGTSTTEYDLFLGDSKKWNKDTKVVIKLTSSEEQTINVRLQKETVISLPTSDKQKIKDGQTLWYSLKSNEDCRYFIETHDVAENVSLNMEFFAGSINYQVGDTDGNGFYYSYVGRTGKNDVIFKLTSSGAEAETDFSIGTGIVTPESVNAGDAKDIKVADTEPNHMVWYSFTPAEAGRYVVKTSGEPSARAIKFYGTEATSGNDISLPNEILVSKEEAGKTTYSFAVYYTNSASGEEAAKDFQFSIYKAAQTELTEASPVNVDITKVVEGEKVWVYFKAPADNKYTFTNDSTETLYTRAYKSIASEDSSSVITRLSWGKEVYLEEGAEVLFAAWYTTAPEKAFSIRVSGVNADTLTVSTDETAEPKKVELTSTNPTKWLKLTAADAARYKVEMTSASETGKSATVQMYQKLSDDTAIPVSDSYVFGADKDQTVYFKLNAADLGETDKVTVSIKVMQEAKMTALELSQNTVSDIEANGEKWVYFTAEEAGFYQFNVNGDCEVRAYKTVNGTGEVSFKNKSITYGLEKGESLYFKVENNTAAAASENIRISKTSTPVKELSVGETDKVELKGYDSYAWYIFTAPEDGTYSISAKTKGVRFRSYENLNETSVLDSYSKGYRKTLSKGETVYLQLINDYGSEQTVTVSCAKVKEREFTGTGTITETLGKGEVLSVTWIAGARGAYSFGFNAKYDVSYEYYDNYEDISYEGASSAQVWQTVMDYSDSEAELFIVSEKENNTVTISAEKTKRQLKVNSYASVWFEDEGDNNETLYVTPSETGKYVFAFEEYGNVRASLYDSKGTTLLATAELSDDSGYARMICSLNANEEVQLRIQLVDKEYSGGTYVRLFKYEEYNGTVSANAPYSWTVNGGCEAWTKLKVDKEGLYQFSYGVGRSVEYYEARMSLYDKNADELKTSGSNVFTIWLEQNEEVWLSTRLYEYDEDENGSLSSSSYTLVVEAVEPQIRKHWHSLNLTPSSNNESVYVEPGYMLEIPLSLRTGGVYQFSKNREDKGNLNLALYLNGSEEPVTSGRNTIEYKFDPAEITSGSAKLRIYCDKYASWNGRITTTFISPLQLYELALGEASDEVTVSNGNEAWFTYTIPGGGHLHLPLGE